MAMQDTNIRVLVLGASGMLGNAVLRLFAASPHFETFGTLRATSPAAMVLQAAPAQLLTGVDVENGENFGKLLATVQPDVVINCVGLVKQLAEADDPLQAVPINSLLPHQLARQCAHWGARFIHMSTDCVFSGSSGNYKESDFADARDLYGRSKYLGEVDYDNAITLRTSIIGHELRGNRSLLGWFLGQTGPVSGYTRAIFSGLPTVEIARVIRDFVIPAPSLRGVYHVSAEPISKFDLLTLIAKTYGKTSPIIPDESLVIDRSLDSTRFRAATGYQPPTWPELVRVMHEFG
jgi:dTDP-4-dehydrorhamnose reductase